jgi:hypothetical protein
VNIGGILSKLTEYGFYGWAVMEWECCINSSQQGAIEGAPFIARHIIEAAETSFDDFADATIEKAAIRKLLGLAAEE